MTIKFRVVQTGLQFKRIAYVCFSLILKCLKDILCVVKLQVWNTGKGVRKKKIVRLKNPTRWDHEKFTPSEQRGGGELWSLNESIYPFNRIVGIVCLNIDQPTQVTKNHVLTQCRSVKDIKSQTFYFAYDLARIEPTNSGFLGGYHIHCAIEDPLQDIGNLLYYTKYYTNTLRRST